MQKTPRFKAFQGQQREQELRAGFRRGPVLSYVLQSRLDLEGALSSSRVRGRTLLSAQMTKGWMANGVSRGQEGGSLGPGGDSWAG